MPWIILLISAVFEAVWATALGMSNGLTEPAPTIVFFIGLAISMAGLGWAVRHLPIGTSYAVWVGIGAALTVAYAMATGAESVSVGKIAFVSGIIAAVIGLKLVPHTPRKKSAGRGPTQ
jgi:Membrane transporters of cations and cationic drugs